MLITKSGLKSLFIAHKANFQRGLQSRENPEWASIATLVNSTTKAEEYGWLGQVPRLREWIGDRVIKNISDHGYTIKNRKFELTLGVGRDDIEDDNLGIYGPLFEEMGLALAEWPDDLVFELLKAGESELCYDGKAFFAADHPEADGVASNLQAGGGAGWYLFDTSRSLKPLIFQQRKAPRLVSKTSETDDNVFDRDEYVYGTSARGAAGFGFWQMAFKSKDTLDATNFDDAVTAMMTRKNDEGHSLKIRPNLLMVGPSNRAAARNLIQIEKQAGGGDNPLYKSVDVIVTTELD